MRPPPLAGDRPRLRFAAPPSVKTGLVSSALLRPPPQRNSGREELRSAAAIAQGARRIAAPLVRRDKSPYILMASPQGSATGQTLCFWYHNTPVLGCGAATLWRTTLRGRRSPTYLEEIDCFGENFAFYAECEAISAAGFPLAPKYSLNLFRFLY